jgi:hypothetical protein
VSITTHNISVFSEAGEDTARIEESMSVLCASLEKIAIGQDAQKLLNSGNIPESASLVVLPAWSWQHPRIDVGRKDKFNGGRVMLPVRVSWTSGSVIIVPAGSTHLFSYDLCGLGNTGSGTVTVSNTAATVGVLRSADRVDGQLLSSRFSASVGTRTSITYLLKKLVEEGKNEKWALMERMNNWSVNIFKMAAGAVSNEITGGAPGEVKMTKLTDMHLLDQLRQKFILGEDNDEDSACMRLIDRCLASGTFAKVDPIKYITTSIRENAERAIRVAIDDPRTGRKVRTLSRELGITDIEELREAYRVFYPKERTGKELIFRALNATLDSETVELGAAFELMQSDLYGNLIR